MELAPETTFIVGGEPGITLSVSSSLSYSIGHGTGRTILSWDDYVAFWEELSCATATRLALDARVKNMGLTDARVLQTPFTVVSCFKLGASDRVMSHTLVGCKIESLSVLAQLPRVTLHFGFESSSSQLL